MTKLVLLVIGLFLLLPSCRTSCTGNLWTTSPECEGRDRPLSAPRY